jgi:hypothetical protein
MEGDAGGAGGWRERGVAGGLAGFWPRKTAVIVDNAYSDDARTRALEIPFDNLFGVASFSFLCAQ